MKRGEDLKVYTNFLNSLQNYLSLLLYSFFMEFREISDDEWKLIKPLFHLELGLVGLGLMICLLNSILYVLVKGCRWMDMPARYGHYSTVFRRLRVGWSLTFGREYLTNI